MAPQAFSVHQAIATANGEEWEARYKKIQVLLPADTFRSALDGGQTDLIGESVYAKPSDADTETRYDVVLNWQTNYVHAICDVDGCLLRVEPEILTDDGMMRGFYAGRKGRALDVGCNTGKNMMSAIKYSEGLVDIYGVEYSEDSTRIAAGLLGADHAFLGDAAGDYVDEHKWVGHFTLAHCTFVLQHMPPQGVDAALRNIARSLAAGGEFLTTFKDAPTMERLAQLGMGDWCDEIFTADVVGMQDAYGQDGYIHASIWDDDYYPGVASLDPPAERDLEAPGPHRRELYFYSLDWMKQHAQQYGLVAKEVGVVADAKIPFSVFSWKVVFAKN